MEEGGMNTEYWSSILLLLQMYLQRRVWEAFS